MMWYFYACWNGLSFNADATLSTLHIRQRPHGIKNLDNQIYGLMITFMASRHVLNVKLNTVFLRIVSAFE